MMERAEKWPVNWLIITLVHGPNLARIESNADNQFPLLVLIKAILAYNCSGNPASRSPR